MLRIALAASLVLVSTSMLQAQTTRGKVHRMEIISGGTQTVRYFGTRLTPDEASTLRDLQRLENESSYVRNLNALKQQYVTSERLLEPQRRQVQQQLYSLDVAQNNSMNWLAYAPYGYYSNFGVPAVLPVNGRIGYGGPVSYLGYGGLGTGGAYANLANGLGDNNPVKDSLANVMAQQATPEYAASLEREMDRVVLRASGSSTLRTALNLTSPTETRRVWSDMRAAADEVEKTGSPVVLTLKSGEKVYAKRIKEDKEWVTAELDRKEGGKMRIRMSEVMRIDETPAKGGIRGSD